MLVIKNFVVTLLFICLSIYLVMLALCIAIIILIKNRLFSQININAENRVEFDPPPEYCNENPPPSYEEALKIGV